MATKTIAQNIQITAPRTTPSISATGSLAAASVDCTLNVPNDASIHIIAEMSTDNFNNDIRAFFDWVAACPPPYKTNTYKVGFSNFGITGSRVRLRIPAVTGTITVTSVVITN
jgi:hypothetical protein